MADLRDALAGGHYARKQILSRDPLVAWSHGRRFRTAVSLARRFGGRKILDYGCGDGTFLAMALMSPDAPASAVGAELSPDALRDCLSRYGAEPRLRFVPVGDLGSAEHAHAYDGVFCMEVLEHVVDWNPELERFARLLAPGGRLIVSVPVETGIPVMVKQAVRRVAGWRGIGHYPGTTPYSMGELAAAVCAGSAQHIARPVFRNALGEHHDHKGFNWMRLKRELERRFDVEEVLASPIAWLGPHLATQAWFVARARHDAPRLAVPA